LRILGSNDAAKDTNAPETRAAFNDQMEAGKMFKSGEKKTVLSLPAALLLTLEKSFTI
jgi:hypothetical protein